MEAIIFDMDGLLVDSEPLWHETLIEVFAPYGIHLVPADFRQTTGLRVEEVVAYWFMKELGQDVPEGVNEAVIRGMTERVRERSRLLPGARQALEFAASLGVPVGLASASPQVVVDTTLDSVHVRSLFHVIHSAEHETHSKPHPLVYLRVAEMLNVAPVKCLALEDSLNGIIAAKAARMMCIAVPEKANRADPRFTLADYRFDSLEEFTPDFVAQISAG